MVRYRMRVATPGENKISDGGGRRGTFMVGGKAAAEADVVTPGAVRCAWLGVADIWNLIAQLGETRADLSDRR